MSNRIKLKGTTEKAFDLGLTNKFTLDATGFTASRTWTLPDSNGSNGQALVTNGSGVLSWGNVSANPAGSNTQVQFNNSGSFGADSDFTYDSTNNVLTIGKAVIGTGFGGAAITGTDVANPIYIVGLDKTGTGGAAQNIELYAGNGAGTNNNGGAIAISSGSATGTGVGGNVSIDAYGTMTLRRISGGQITFEPTGAINISAGTGGVQFGGSVGSAGQVLTSNGTGNPTWTTIGAGASQARIQFTAGSNGTGQAFTDSGLSSFTNNTYANVFVNGVLLQTSEYSISGTTLTVSRYLSTGDNIIVAATSPGSISGTLAATSGGTGIATYTTGDMLYASGTNTLAKRAIGTTGQVLTVSGGVPTWATPASTYSGVALTTIVNLTNTTETYITPTYTLPTISSGMVFKFECYAKIGSGVSSTLTLRVRVGSAGTTADTEIYNDTASTSTNQFPVKFEGTITFNGSTSILRVGSTKITSQTATYTAGQTPVGVNENGPYTGLTPTYLGITAQASTGTAGQYLTVYGATITRVL